MYFIIEERILQKKKNDCVSHSSDVNPVNLPMLFSFMHRRMNITWGEKGENTLLIKEKSMQ